MSTATRRIAAAFIAAAFALGLAMTAIWTAAAIVFLGAVLAAVTRAPHAGLEAHEERGLACPHCPARLYMPGKALDHLISIHNYSELKAWDAIHEGSKR